MVCNLATGVASVGTKGSFLLPFWICSHLSLGHGALAEAVCVSDTPSRCAQTGMSGSSSRMCSISYKWAGAHRGGIWCDPSDRNSPLTAWTEMIACLGGLSWAPGLSDGSWAWPERQHSVQSDRSTSDQSFSCLAAAA